MDDSSGGRVWRFTWSGPVGSLALLWLVVPGARAADPLGIYAGGAIGQARVDASLPNAGQFSENHSAYKIMVGLRPIGVLGAELAYVDFGHPGRFDGAFVSDVTMKGAAALAMFYFPVPVVDVYAKGGLARLKSTASVACPLCLIPVSIPPLSRTNVSWAAGAGVQYKLGRFAVRGEYERFNAAGGNPYLSSLGATWSF